MLNDVKLKKGDVVLFVPKSIKRWNKKCYMLGFVVDVVGGFVYIKDIAGEMHVDYIQRVRYVYRRV